MVYRHCIESGPQDKKTIVRVLDLLGCITNGLTAEEERSDSLLHQKYTRPALSMMRRSLGVASGRIAEASGVLGLIKSGYVVEEVDLDWGLATLH